MRKRWANYFLILYACHCVATARFWGIVKETDDDDDDDDEDKLDEDHVEAEPTTDGVIEPDIKTGNPIDPSDDEEDEFVDPIRDTNRAIRDVAYFLRTHKFKDFDHRYYKSIAEVPKRLYQEFAKPPLRSLHWEVREHCAVSFKSCLKFINKVVKLTHLKREDDTVTIMREQSWDVDKNKKEIVATQNDCENAKRKDNITADPFQGPIERFQWRSTASYYMCWYTMLGTSDLALFGEPCDNMAYCLDHYGMSNKDPRADDTKPFACAIYSFCPDPCCPLEHVWYMKDCYESVENPCYGGNSPENRKCVMRREDNQDFESLIKNQLNVSCPCQEPGYEWSSRFGICVDIDECRKKSDNCSTENMKTCVNLPGYYDCVCNLGYVYSKREKKCIFSNAIDEALRGLADEGNNETVAKSILAMIAQLVTKSGASRVEGNAITYLVSFLRAVMYHLFSYWENNSTHDLSIRLFERETELKADNFFRNDF